MSTPCLAFAGELTTNLLGVDDDGVCGRRLAVCKAFGLASEPPLCAWFRAFTVRSVPLSPFVRREAPAEAARCFSCGTSASLPTTAPAANGETCAAAAAAAYPGVPVGVGAAQLLPLPCAYDGIAKQKQVPGEQNETEQ